MVYILHKITVAIIAGDIVTNFYILKVITFTEGPGTGKTNPWDRNQNSGPWVGRGMNGQVHKGSFWPDGSSLPDRVWVTQVHATIKTQ